MKQLIFSNMTSSSSTPQLIDSANFSKFINASKAEPNDETTTLHHVPMYVKEIIVQNNLEGIEDEDTRARIFLQEMFTRNKSQRTVRSHFTNLKPFLFPRTNVRPNFDVFELPIKQLRTPNVEEICLIVKYCLANVKNDKRTIPLLFAYYTALRSSEICSLTIFHLLQLAEKQPLIRLSRKTNNEWSVVYYEAFDEFISILVEDNYKLQILTYKKYDIDSMLFDITPRMLGYYLRSIYMLTVNCVPTYGFGIHVFRYFMATRLAEKGKKELARQILGHVDLRTTDRYVKSNNVELQRQLQFINTNVELYRNLLHIGERDDSNKQQNINSDTLLGTGTIDQ